MAKAREQIADEAHTAEEVEKDAWRQGETKRVEDMVRALYEIIYPPLSSWIGVHVDRSKIPSVLAVLLDLHIVWQVRQEYATLQDATDGRESVSPTSKEVSGKIGHMLPRFPGHVSQGYDSHRGRKAVGNVSARHPALQPSALGEPIFRIPEHAGAPMEAVAHQMAGVLRAVEAKVQRIEVSGVLARLSLQFRILPKSTNRK